MKNADQKRKTESRSWQINGSEQQKLATNQFNKVTISVSKACEKLAHVIRKTYNSHVLSDICHFIRLVGKN